MFRFRHAPIALLAALTLTLCLSCEDDDEIDLISPPVIVINEIMARNASTITDEAE